MIRDRMGNIFASEKQIPDYGTLFLIKERPDGINDYGGSDAADAAKLNILQKRQLAPLAFLLMATYIVKTYLVGIKWAKLQQRLKVIVQQKLQKL